MKHTNLEEYFLTQDIVLSDEGLDKIVEAVLADQAEQSDERREYTIKNEPIRLFSNDGENWEVARYVSGNAESGYRAESVNGKGKVWKFMNELEAFRQPQPESKLVIDGGIVTFVNEQLSARKD